MHTWLVRFIFNHAERRTYVNADTLPEALAKWKGHYPAMPDRVLTSIALAVHSSNRSAA